MSKVDSVFLSWWILTIVINVCSAQTQSICGPNQWQCSDKSCIFLIERCDNFPNCPDASDEKGCLVDLKPNISAARPSIQQTTSSELDAAQPSWLEPWESEMSEGEVTSTTLPIPAATQVIGSHTWFPPGLIMRENIPSMEVLKPRTAAPKQPTRSPMYMSITQKQTTAPKQPTPAPVYPSITQKQTISPKQPTPSPVFPSITQKQTTSAAKQPAPSPVFPSIAQKQTTETPKQPTPSPVYPLITQKQTTAAPKLTTPYPESPKLPSRQQTTAASRGLPPYPEQPIILPKQHIATTQEPIAPQTEIISRYTWFPPIVETTSAPPIRVTTPSVEVALQTTRQSIVQPKQLIPIPEQPTIPTKQTRSWTAQPEITTTPLKQQMVTLEQFKVTSRHPVTPSKQPTPSPKQPTGEHFWIPPVKRTTTPVPVSTAVMAKIPTESYVTNPFGLEITTMRNPCVQVDDPYEFCRRRYRGYYRHPEDCKEYVVCEWGFLHVCACPDMTQWDQQTLTCAWLKPSECVTGIYDKPIIPNNYKDTSDLHPPSINILNTVKPLSNRFATVPESTTRTVTDAIRPLVMHRTLPATPSWLKELSEKRYLTPKEPEPIPYQGLLTRFFKPENTSRIAGQPN